MNKNAIFGIVGVLLLAGIGALAYQVYALSSALSAERAAFAEQEALAKETEARLAEQLAARIEEASSLAGKLREEEEDTAELTKDIRKLTGTVTTLEKLTRTDKQLLAKYSKVYFLNENYSPIGTEQVPEEYGFQEGRVYEIHESVAPFLEKLLEEAAEDELNLKVASAYRSFESQGALKSAYSVRYGSGANAFSADQGYSEHQLGTTVDFTTPTVGGSFAGFQRTDEYDWLMDNAWRYGFVLSYPPGNTYYQYEPWHWRFVGTKLAKRLHEDDMWFYDLDQRVIDEYLVELFD